MDKKILPVLRKVDIPGTLERLPENSEHWTKASAFASISSVRCTITRLNARAGRMVYEVVSTDNGESFTIKKN